MPQEPHRDERKSAVPWLSPGLVQSDEIVLRTLLDPDHLEPDGKLKVAAAISLEDIRFRGWSVDRRKFTSLQQVRLFHSGLKKRNTTLRKCYVLPIPVSEIRQRIPPNKVQDFVVIDAALWRKPSHATVLLFSPQTPSAARKFRNDLLKKLPPYVDVTEAFDSTDKHGFLRGMLRQFAAILASPFRYII
ncbi:MAG TPA: hypothetical protein VNE63_13715 [Candidatus Acidoferrales bacterium]|nr:hypothetical protein [Candidatus Acidoferrales bacterium]